MGLQVASRRDLMAALTLALAPGSDERLLAVVRLHGLNDLRDRAGLDAEERLLASARRRLLVEVGCSGRAYQTRRDELCVLFECPFEKAIQLLDNVTAALNQLARASGVKVEAGVTLLPEEAADPISALERADRRTLASADAGSGITARSERRTPEQARRIS
jgi:GGDEF domain-containing protein